MKTIPTVVTDTGISEDYKNEYWAKMEIYQHFIGKYDKVRAEAELLSFLKERPVRRYVERFPPSEYDIDLDNPRIPLLNQLADEANQMAESGRVDGERFAMIGTLVSDIISGKI